MKKIFIFVLLLLLFGCSTNKDKVLKDLSEYTTKNIYLSVFPNMLDDSYTLGSGILVEDSGEGDLAIFPVYSNDEYVGAAFCSKYNGGYSLAFPTDYDKEVERLVESDKDFVVFKSGFYIYGSDGDETVDLVTGQPVHDSFGKFELKAYDSSKKTSIYVPQPKASVSFGGNGITFDKEDSKKLFELVTKTPLYYIEEFNPEIIGFKPFFSLSILYGDELTVLRGMDPAISATLVIDNGANSNWSYSNPYGELYDFTRHLIQKYSPSDSENLADKYYDMFEYNPFYELCAENKTELMSWGVYASSDKATMTKIFEKLGIEKEIDRKITIMDYYLQHQGVVELNREIECEDFFIKVVSIGSKGIIFNLKSRNSIYENVDGYITTKK